MEQKNKATSKQSDQQVSKYRVISTDIWNLFKKYLPIDADLTSFTEDVHKLDQKYHEMNDLEAYGFMQKLLKVYFEELNRIKG